jgi:hypothetical protein
MRRNVFSKRILYLQEYRGGKDAQYLIRQLQSEGRITHEATTVLGGKRGTQVVRQIGIPVVLTSTTEWKVFPDDATRFLSVSVDESKEQTRAIARAQIGRGHQRLEPPLQVWQRAVSLIKRKKEDFQNPPEWLHNVAEQLPAEQVRVRRDWSRYLRLCQAIALCRRGVSDEPTDITFADYVVAYKIFEPALASTSSDIHPQELELLRAIKKLRKRSPKGVTVTAITEYLEWDRPRVYKTLDLAAKHKAIEYKPGTREKNEKLIVAVRGVSRHFLPRPIQVLRGRKDLPKVIRFVDPLTGKRKKLTRR